ncbi:murein hydrolase activator EnvC family protein [Halomonas halocynthiae]|uniref:murein hydrolase activator EnvC family protein n=1 Tax=Halomonas halocynthiae TaxID=176290 RepID=UPI001F0B47EB|nr:peptidoglycan DD-metalloendopeptidase family protein [Halomonas halocynthiae]
MAQRSRLKTTLLAAVLGLCLLPMYAAGQSVNQAKATLDDIGQQIKNANRDLATTHSARDSASAELRALETKLADTHQRLSALQEEQNTLELSIGELQARQEHLNRAQEEQLQALAEQLDALYRLGQTPQLKLLLNQDDPAQLDRIQTYLNHLTRARQTILNTLAQLESAVAENTQTLHERDNELNILAESLEQTSADLARQVAQRETLVKQLNEQYASEEARLVKLDQDRAHAERILQQVQEKLARMNRPPPSTGIEQTRGDLPWPAQGRIISGFRHGRGVHRNGLVIAASEGTPVTAVHAGRVVFADWMRGFGNMLIIDHGDNVMTLHAHLQHFSVDVGQPVQRGHTLGAVGSSGGQPIASLYFEVRRNGKPINPRQWMARR